jgi:transposase-like protein
VRGTSTCPHYQRTHGQVKVGRNESGTQRYLYQACLRKYTPRPKVPDYGKQVRRHIARQLGVAYQAAIVSYR